MPIRVRLINRKQVVVKRRLGCSALLALASGEVTTVEHVQSNQLPEGRGGRVA